MTVLGCGCRVTRLGGVPGGNRQGLGWSRGRGRYLQLRLVAGPVGLARPVWLLLHPQQGPRTAPAPAAVAAAAPGRRCCATCRWRGQREPPEPPRCPPIQPRGIL